MRVASHPPGRLEILHTFALDVASIRPIHFDPQYSTPCWETASASQFETSENPQLLCLPEFMIISGLQCGVPHLYNVSETFIFALKRFWIWWTADGNKEPCEIGFLRNLDIGTSGSWHRYTSAMTLDPDAEAITFLEVLFYGHEKSALKNIFRRTKSLIHAWRR